VVLQTEELEVDESLLTGESDPVVKRTGEQVLSGSVVVAGTGVVQVTQIGERAYAHRLTADVQRFSVVRSELVTGINRLLGYISWVVVVVGPILFWSQMRSQRSWQDAVTRATAGLVGMVPEGLVLLTSLAFLLAALTLARHQVLVQELPAVELLARVDTLCVDKTGTLTEGVVGFAEYRLVPPEAGRTIPASSGDGPLMLVDRVLVDGVLGEMAVQPSPNSTERALARAFATSPGWAVSSTVGFSSARKWSAITFVEHGSWVLGAPDVILADGSADPLVLGRANELAAEGRRVLLLGAAVRSPSQDAALPPIVPIALLIFDEVIRADAADTIGYLVEQGIAVKVISGDHPRTIAAVAARVGVPGADRIIDARQLPEDPEAMAQAAHDHAVFARVTPQQKRALVRALQARGHVVAMTGDGVNDLLALKEADLGIAMGSGAPAARSVARLILVDNRFDRLPVVIDEGRRVMANIERVAGLFVVKNVYSAALALAVAVAGLTFPFLPRQLTVISALTIGLPGFVLALSPGRRRYRAGFLTRVLRFSLPVGAMIGAGVFASYDVARLLGVPAAQAHTAAAVTLVIAGLWVLATLAGPMNTWKTALIATMGGVFAACLILPGVRDFLELEIPVDGLAEAVAIGVALAVAITAIGRINPVGREHDAARRDEPTSGDRR